MTLMSDHTMKGLMIPTSARSLMKALVFFALGLSLNLRAPAQEPAPLKVLILTGSNNHDW